jgi:hypothetical protein
LLGVEARVQTAEQQQETLRGLSGVAVVVEPLHAEAEQDGLSAQQLQAAVERQLQEADIRVLSNDEWSTTLGGPYLYINRAALKKDYGLYAFSVEVCVDQLVALLRDLEIKQFAETWERREVGTVGVEKLASLEQSVTTHVGAFMTAYRAVNPVQDDGMALRRNSEKQ